MSSEGYIVIRVFTSDAQIPIESATVTVTQTQDGIAELLAVRLTDESGKTDKLTVPAPAEELSREPSRAKPYASITVTAEHPLYERVVAENVQIFAGTLTQQNMQLIPLDELPEKWNETESFPIPSQDL